ncbi:SpoIIE family protein phosphatase [Streptomyces iranensis]|uniref:Serine phosphatase RsbU (Regulator of sigma subunit)/anti-sigma regulatory factor (Ser/Thr protein kinase) n=2 Tax=Streptomyces iranensis TaxID=576784 RepID=A0ABS4MUH1_9ACTN|nr:SpoIIE family protein phosphatase [Streptomyces iranensis]MBP2063380.1 serine phosphatase RsbU (regulator of sigma subunit)/anti-sigma regulatory factor (Ser/Thr protein kinase) [Streptomyces iranensis]
MNQMAIVAEGGLRDLARARERFLEGEPVARGVRNVILSSWQRCRYLRISPNDDDPLYRQDYDTTSRLVRAAGPVLDWLAAKIAGTEMFVTLTDGKGTALQHRFGGPSMIKRLRPVQAEPGFNVAEQFAGTNAVAMALAERRPSFVVGAEHFSESGQSEACISFPLRDPLDGHIEGIIDFDFPVHDTIPMLESLMHRAVEAIERGLLEQRSARERALLQAYLETRNRANTPDMKPDGQHFQLGELAESTLHWRDQMLLRERAAELISSGQKAAIEVPLSHGQAATLLSRPVTSDSGVVGVAVEAVFARGGSEHRLAVATPAEEPPGSTPQRSTPPAVPLLGVTRPPGAPPERTTPRPPSTTGERLLLVGEPEVGKIALAARRRLELLSDASALIGTTLDVTRTAQELAEIAVPRFADIVIIDLSDAVIRGEESPEPQTDLRRTVSHGVRDDYPFHPVGDRISFAPATPQARCLASGHPQLESDLKAAAGWLSQEPEHSEDTIVGHNIHSLITAPLNARGVALGVASFYRLKEHGPFTEDDCSLAHELAVRAALPIDNARRYTREHTMVLALQRSLLPHDLPDQNAVEVACRYLPAEAGVGGDWFDVIPLSGARVALVVGDVVGHGLHAAATMGRLRTAIHNYSALDLAPDELLTHLDKLVGRLDQDETATDEESATGGGVIGATCLYAIYDPTSQRCSLARAGHLPPAFAHPDGTVTFPDLPAGPPLGLGGFPFETADIHIPEGSRLLLYTNGLIDNRHGDIDTVLDRLGRDLSHSGLLLEDSCQVVLDAVVPDHRHDDIALLLARTRALDPDQIAHWDVPADPAAVSDIRAAVTRKLSDWRLDEVAFTTELLLSELVTNAIRYGSGPIQVRLLRDRSLICEVSDTSSTSPHLRHAASTDEGGRGLFLVAQLAEEWGTRYTDNGKIIWAEQPLPAYAV